MNCVQSNCVLSLYHQTEKMKDQLHISEQVCFPVYVFAKEIINQYRPLLEALELTYPQYLVMLVLWEHKEQTVNQLGEKLKLDSGTLTPLLKRMEHKEFVSRIRSTVDERLVNISLTEKGKALKEKAAFIPGQLMEAMDVTDEDLLLLKNIITKISKK
ncbi:Organic hydroperoxide resistance transcriptional regulator [Flavobacterium sp. PL0002]|nr:Organic hydroperoxide resistance transcriptional regulator [Flavobacterium sp. PL002]